MQKRWKQLLNLSLTPEVLRSGVPVKPGTVLLRTEGGETPGLGSGTAMSPNGSFVVATVEGLALVGRQTVLVVPAQLRRSDVHRGAPLVATGNLVVMGALQPGAQIKAGGSVGVMGEAQDARIEALGSVTLMAGCSHSVIRAGANNQVYQSSLDRLEAAELSLDRLLGVIQQLQEHPSFRMVDLRVNLKLLMQVLVEQSFAAFPGEMSRVLKQCQLHAHLGGAVAALGELVERRFSGTNLLTITIEEVQRARQLTLEAMDLLVKARDAQQRLTIRYRAVESTLRSNGTIEVQDGDLQACKVEAGAGVRVDGRIASCVVVAQEWIEATDVDGGCSVEVSGPGEIRALRIHSDALVRVGHRSVRLDTVVSPAVVHLSQGNLAFQRSQEVAQNA